MKSVKTLYAVVLALLLASGVVSCKKDKDSDDTFVYTTSTSSTLVSSFALVANSDVMANLDSVYFTIDPERGLIYNADSLPVGTDVSALKVTVGFKSAVSQAVFSVTDANQSRTEYEYTSTSSDAMDFRYGVRLTVTSSDGACVKDYEVKVNVHQIEPDSLVWPMSARRNLPGATDVNYALGIAMQEGRYWCLLHNQDGYVMSQAATPAGPWTTTKIGGDFAADASTLSATEQALWVLGGDGRLLTSADGLSWAATDVQWTSLIGIYQDRVLGLVPGEDGTLLFDEYPRRSDFTPTGVPADFPVKRFSQLVTVTGSWAVAPQAVLVGGVQADGAPSAATWAFDGATWAKINSPSSVLPPLDGPTLLSYYTHVMDTQTLKVSRRVTWLVLGGHLKDGTANTTTYVSNNQGITWLKGASSLAQAPSMPSLYCARAWVYDATLSQDGVQWQCPYIYIAGGLDFDGFLHNDIWQGVLPRMTFKPLK
ncbi:MAG: hypothetical protein IJT30_00965 [Muribaculaceae bacterium]|nr:hypothetical protein [Muribaculaceae bacterium]